jgi:hypothetical protein
LFRNRDQREKTGRKHPLALLDANLSSIQAYTDLVCARF